jgi:uncharacterized protein
MTMRLTDALCTRCGLCCDGSLFADLELAGRVEADGLEVLGLAIEDDGAGSALLPQPCGALRGIRCRIYTHRPQCCRTFECRLLQDVRRGAVSLRDATTNVAEVRSRIDNLGELLSTMGRRDGPLPLAERCAEALAGRAGADPRLNRKRGELQRAMAAVKRSLGTMFLSDGGSGAPGRNR